MNGCPFGLILHMLLDLGGVFSVASSQASTALLTHHECGFPVGNPQDLPPASFCPSRLLLLPASNASNVVLLWTHFGTRCFSGVLMSFVESLTHCHCHSRLQAHLLFHMLLCLGEFYGKIDAGVFSDLWICKGLETSPQAPHSIRVCLTLVQLVCCARW